ncbi:MAG: deoxynucleoside kinase [Bacilli bacterium]|nr:deoxynucleoside kinase [Bacilli bacterium]
MKGKLIVIEGTDCSGKETQSNLLLENLRKEDVRIQMFSYPNYQSPTGKIVGGPYLGKPEICKSYFAEGASHVDPVVSSLYYAADRKYNIHKITWLLENGVHVILDRYVYSNMAHQGGKIKDQEKRNEMYQFLDTLEFGLLELPKPDIAILLHLPLKETLKLRETREYLDDNEKDIEHLENAEKAYQEIAKKYQFKVIECAENGLKKIADIQTELYAYVKSIL